MGTTVADVIGANSGSAALKPSAQSLQEDAEPCGFADMPVQPTKGANIDPWRIKTDALDMAGICKGMIVFVDLSAETVENVAPLQCVVAQIYGGLNDKTITVVRQFVPPSLLITNTSGENEKPLDLNKGEAYIKGVIVGKYQGV